MSFGLKLSEQGPFVFMSSAHCAKPFVPPNPILVLETSVSVYLQLQNGCRVLEVVEHWPRAHSAMGADCASLCIVVFFFGLGCAREKVRLRRSVGRLP